ncbi:MAG: pyridoxal-phosphate dependent enzyme [Acidobacteria bacterium]|nr:pyridoxal-phosphate dependent enzyme [Acidobacteriota bacterium]
MSALVESAAIEAAAGRIRGVVRRTPLVDVADIAGRPLRLKCENLQVAGAFKIRGACNLVSQIASGSDVRGVITYSSGNHAQAVACAARGLGLPAVVVMPETAPAVKVEGTRSYGAEVFFEGTTSVQRRRRAEALAAERGLTMVPPFDHHEIIAGQGTVGLEIVADVPQVDTVYAPIGGGGLIAGVAAAVKRARPAARIIGVEPVGAAAMARSVEAGAPVTLDSVASVADGLLPVRPGDLTFAHVAAFVDDIVTVEDDAIVSAVRWLATRAKLVVEPSGAASVAAVLFSGRRDVRTDGVTVAVLSGGNIGPVKLAALLQEGERTA